MSALRGITLALLGLMLGCAASPVDDPFAESLRRWPEEPGMARIELVGTFGAAADLGITGSAWSRLVGMTAGRSDSPMERPMSVVSSEDDTKIFVADPDAGCVHLFDLAKNRYRCIRAKHGDGAVAPVGLSVSDAGRLFVADSANGKIWQLRPGERTLEPFYVSASLEQPTGIFWDESGQFLYVTDTPRHCVLQFDGHGNLKREFGSNGVGPGQLNYPTYLWFDRNHGLLVSDSLNFRLQRYSPDGTFIGGFGTGGDLPGDFSRPKGVAADTYGHIYVIDALMHTMQILDVDGRLLLAVGEQGQGGGQFWLPNGIFISDDNTIYVTDAYNKRVQVFRYVGPSS